MNEIIELLDKVDDLIRKKLKVPLCGNRDEKNALKEAMELIQKAITILLYEG